MQRHIITVKSITYAIKGRDLLRKQGIKAFIERKINPNGDVGCGYVIVADGNKHKIKQAIMQSNIDILDLKTIV